MARINRVTDPAKIVTDPVMLRELGRQVIDKDYVEFWKDYATEHPGAKFYRDLKSGKRFMVVSGLPRVEGAGRKIEVGWLAEKGRYYAKANLFSAIVDGTAVRVGIRQDKATWNPQLFLNGIEQSCGEATLLEVDPGNENYRDNVLEWGYGICKRRLRIIHGAIFERWIVLSNPFGEVEVKHNFSQNDIGVRLSGAWDAEGNRLGRIEDDSEIISKEEFNRAVYPVTIGADLTVYSTASDGSMRGYNGTGQTCTEWRLARDEANAESGPQDTLDYIEVGDYMGGGYARLYRGGLFFDTSGVGANDIESATMNWRVYWVDGDDQYFTLVDGTDLDDPMALADYGQLLDETTNHGRILKSGLSTLEYRSFALTADGLAHINKTGTTKWGIRGGNDIDDNCPSGGWDAIAIWAQEKGVGYQPKLVITYTAVTAKASSDAGASSEASSQQAALSENDSGSGAESLGSRDLALGETGSGAGVSSLLAVLVGTAEAGLGAEFAAKIFSALDSGTGVDAVMARLLTTTESGSALEASLLSGALISDDGGLGSELSILLRALIASDEGSGFAVLRALIEIPATGSDMKLPPGSGQVGIPSKGVNL